MTTTYSYDVESFGNFFSAVFINEDETDKHVFVLHDSHQNDTPQLIEFLQRDDLTLVGHNSLDYDNLMLRAILLYPNITGGHLQRLTKRLIEGDRADRINIPHYSDLAWPANSQWVSIDTLALTRVNDIRVGLKHAGVVLRHHRLQDLPLPPGSIVTPDMVQQIIDYNANDAQITSKLYRQLKPIIDMRRDVSASFDVDVLTANDTEIAKQILARRYCEATGITQSELKKLRTERNIIHVKDCIGSNIQFETPELRAVLDAVKKKRLYPENYYKYRIDLTFDGVDYKIGVGGLHSDDPARILTTTDEFIIRDCDVESFYPNILLKNGFYPEHLGAQFLTLYQGIVNERIEAKGHYKKYGDKPSNVKQAGLKIAINSGFGLMGNRYSWLYDPRALVSITISGQLYLLDLIEKLALAGIHTLSANTDGIVCKIPRDLEATYFEVCRAWEARTGFVLEYTDYERLIQRDVNNYLTIKPDGKTKTKGIFQNDVGFVVDGNFYDTAGYNAWLNGEDITKYQIIPGFSKGFRHPIVTIALYQYYVHGIDPEQTIRNHRDVTDFLISQRADINKFDIVATSGDDNVSMQKTNRYLVTQLGYGASLRKAHKRGGKDVAMVAGEHLLILNDIDSFDAHDYNIKYVWYEKQVWDVINKITPPQWKGELW